MDTPRTNELYRTIAKDYQPKVAAMNICKYIQGLESRIQALETKEREEAEKPAEEQKQTRKRRTTTEE